MPSKENQSRTSKTARVMNLISKKTDPAPSADNTENASTPTPPVLASLTPDAVASSQIKNALEDELAGALNTDAEPAPDVQPPEAAVPQPEPEPVSTQPVKAPEPQPEPVMTAPVQQTPPPPAPAPVAPAVPDPVQSAAVPVPETPRFLEPEDPGYINVMQVLVEEKASVYTNVFGLCQCKRCLEDVKAITLNNLPPKYVVLAEGDRIPRLTVYEGRFGSEITSRLLQACELVKNRPHHTRDE